MNHNFLKSLEEIELIMDGHQKLVMFTCVACVARSGAGGYHGMKQMHDVLTKMGKEIVYENTATAPCIETLSVPFVKKYRDKIDQADAVVALTCTGGMQMFTHLIPDKPVLCPVDMEGSKMMQLNPSKRDYYSDLVVNGNCISCEHCVMAYTAGICPITSCPLGDEVLYGPCENAPEEGDTCAVDPDHKCVWVEIKKRSWDLESLKGLKEIHEKNYPRVESFGGEYAAKPAPEWMRNTMGNVTANVEKTKFVSVLSRLAQHTF